MDRRRQGTMIGTPQQGDPVSEGLEVLAGQGLVSEAEASKLS